MTNKLLLSRRLVIILFACLLTFSAFSQSNYSLLWKISGNGLSRPSYLFGTMHVKDKRVFNFSDSVMVDIQNCSYFALEVHPDTLIKKMFELLQNKDTLRNIDKLLNKEQYNKLAKKFQEKNGYKMTKTDPLILESLMEPDDNKPDDKISFIDAYLYGMARTFNKNILGLEDASSQLDQYYGSGNAIKERLIDLLDNDESSDNENREEMIKVYSTGDLNAIYNYARENGMVDSVIAQRNKVMANSIIRYMANGTIFSAVGVAHLPGPQGIIALLKKAGYQVSQVQATFTGVANRFKIDYTKMNWPVHRDERMGYAINFPGVPIKYTQSDVNTILYPDMANDIYYGLYAVPRGTLDNPANWKEVIDQKIESLSKINNNHIISKKEFLYDKLHCAELLVKNNGGYIRLRMIFGNNLLYVIYAGSKHNHLNQSYADRFFNSFTSLPIPTKTAARWISYSNPKGAFAVKLPFEPKEIVKEVPSQMKSKQVVFKLNMYIATDTLNSRAYLLRYNDYPSGTFLADKNMLFNSLISEFKDKGKIVAEPVKIWKDGYEGRELNIILTGGFNTKIRLFARGNRVYILLKELLQPGLKDNNTTDAFFDSFRLLPYAEPEYYTYEPDSADFKITMVSKPQVISSATKSYTNYFRHTVVNFCTNPNSGGFYDLEYSTFSPYFRTESIDTLYKNMIDRLVGYEDSLLKIDVVSLNGIKGREFSAITKSSLIKKRTRIFIDGDNFYYLSAKVDSSELFDKTGNMFYNSLILKHTLPKFSLTTSKAEKIYHDLGSTDTLVYKTALGALSYYTFTTDELPYIYSALKRNYPDDTSKDGARYMLIKEFKTVNNDSTINFLSDLYHNLNGNDDLRGCILNVLPFINKKTGYDVYLKLFTSHPPVKIKEAYEIFTPLTDSIEFAATHFLQLLPFIKYDNYRSQLLGIAKHMADRKNAGYDKILKENYLTLIAYAAADIDHYVSLKDSNKNPYNSMMYNYMQLIGKIKFANVNNRLTKRYLEIDPKGLYASDAIVARIYNNLPNNQLLVNKYLDSIGTRYDLMEAFDNMKQLNKIQLKYRRQDEYAKLCLYQSISADDYGSPQKIALLGSILKSGSVYYVFKFLLPDKEEKKELIGITGPYKPGTAKLNFTRYYAYTTYEIVKPNWRLQASKMIAPLIEAYK